MFVIQVDFKDGASEIETVLIRRLHVNIGSNDSNHLILEGVSDLGYSIVISRGLGSKFYCKAQFKSNSRDLNFDWEGEHSCSAQVVYGQVLLTIISVPAFLVERIVNTKGSSSLLNNLNSLIQYVEKPFPAIFSLTEPRVALSLSGVERATIGNSRNCLIRSEKFSEKAEYAILNFLTNGSVTYIPRNNVEEVSINGMRAQQETLINGKDRIRFSSGLEVIYLASEDDLRDCEEEFSQFGFSPSIENRRTIRVKKGNVSPEVLPLHVGRTISIGRDASHNIWIDAPHISRLHCTIYVEKSSCLLTDFSTNGIILDGTKTEKGKPIPLGLSVHTLDFGHDTVLILSDLNDRQFSSFCKGAAEEEDPEISEVLAKPSPQKTELLVNQRQESSELSFEEYQKRTIKLSAESGIELLSDSIKDYDDIASESEITHIGLMDYLPSILIVALVTVIIGFFIVLSLNIIR